MIEHTSKDSNVQINEIIAKKHILDPCCGSRMFWFNKNNPMVLFADNRMEETILCDGRKLIVQPDLLMDFTDMPFPDNVFDLVVFDPPHLLHAGETSWLRKKYGILPQDWKNCIQQGFNECMRVLKPTHTLVFKWNEDQIKTSEILKNIDYKPLFGDKRSKTRWLIFLKEEENE